MVDVNIPQWADPLQVEFQYEMYVGVLFNSQV